MAAIAVVVLAALMLQIGESYTKQKRGRGIKICDRWVDSFVNFYADMGEKPKGMTLERIDNNGNYSPENCKWATRFEQNNNTRKNIRLTHRGISLNVIQWSRKLGINYGTLLWRFHAGWAIERILQD